MLECNGEKRLALIYASIKCLSVVAENPEKALKYGFTEKDIASMKALCEEYNSFLSEEKNIASRKLPHIIGFVTRNKKVKND